MHAYSQYFPVRFVGDALDVAGLVAHNLASASNRSVMTFKGRTWTIAEMGARVAATRGWLHDRGIRPGDWAAVMMGNDGALVELIYALVTAGVVWIPVNSKLKAPGLSHLLEHGRPKLFHRAPCGPRRACRRRPKRDR